MCQGSPAGKMQLMHILASPGMVETPCTNYSSPIASSYPTNHGRYSTPHHGALSPLLFSNSSEDYFQSRLFKLIKRDKGDKARALLSIEKISFL